MSAVFMNTTNKGTKMDRHRTSDDRCEHDVSSVSAKAERFELCFLCRGLAVVIVSERRENCASIRNPQRQNLIHLVDVTFLAHLPYFIRKNCLWYHHAKVCMEMHYNHLKTLYEKYFIQMLKWRPSETSR